MSRSDTFDGHHEPGDVPGARGVRGLAGIAVLIVVLGHTALPLGPATPVGIDVLAVVLGFLLAGWALGDRAAHVGLRRLSGRRRRWVLPLAGVLTVSSLVALWWSTTGAGRSTGLAWWQYGGRVLELASADAVGDPGLWAEDAAWPPGSAVRAVAGVLVLLLACGLLASSVRRAMLRGEAGARRLALVCGGAAYVLVLVVALGVLRDVPLFVDSGRTWLLVAWRGWEVGAGAVLGYLAVGGALPVRGRSSLTVLALAGLLVVALLPEADRLTAAAVAAGAACLILADVSAREPSPVASRLLTQGAAPVLGILGYCWYLWALPALVLAPVLLGETLSWHRSLEVVALALWVGGLTHLLLGRRRTGITQRAVLEYRVVDAHPDAPAESPAVRHARRLAPPHAPGLGAFAGPPPPQEA